MPSDSDLRTKRTHLLLRDTLIDLILEKGFDAVTVKDIAGRAMINRATFYRHFEDKYALVSYIFREAVENMMDEVGSPEQNLAIFVNFDRPDPDLNEKNMEQAIHTMARFYDYFARNEKLYRSLLGKWGSPWFADQMRETLSSMWLERIRSTIAELTQENNTILMSPEMAANGLAHSMVGLITWWLENGRKESSRTMAAISLKYIIYGYFRGLGYS